MRRSALLVLALAAACSDLGAEECPGQPVAHFTFDGAKVAAGALGALDPVPAVPDCGGEGCPAYPEAVTLEGTLAADPVTNAAALCRPAKVTLFGQRSGSRYFVETGAGGAVPSPTCSASLRLIVTGDVVTDGVGQPTSFSGALVEVLSYVDGDCGTCLPCAGRYSLQGTP